MHKVVELPGGFVVTPHLPHYPDEPMFLEQAVLLWYNSHFDSTDPLGMGDILREYITNGDE